MTLHTLNSQNTVLNKFIAQIRDQVDPDRLDAFPPAIWSVSAKSRRTRFRKSCPIRPAWSRLRWAKRPSRRSTTGIVVATILRAGLPYHQGFLNYFDDAENAFVSAYRKSTKDGKFTVKVEYISCGDLEDKVLLLVDPMLATGSSLVLAYNALCEKAARPNIRMSRAVIASEQGIDYVSKNMPASGHDDLGRGRR